MAERMKMSAATKRADTSSMTKVRWAAGVLVGAIGIGLVIMLISYLTGGDQHLLLSAIGPALALVGLAAVLVRTRPGAPPASSSTMAYAVIGLLMFDILAHIALFQGISLYLVGGGVTAAVFLGAIFLPRRWDLHAVLAFVFLALSALIEWLEPLPRQDISSNPTAEFTTPLVFALMLSAFVFASIRSAQATTIRNRLLISFILVALLPGILIAAASVTIGLQSSERTILDSITATADAREGQLSSWVQALELDLAVLRELEYANFRILLSADRDSQSYRFVRAVEQPRLQDTIRLRGNFDAIFLIDQDGLIVLSNDPVDELLHVASDEGLTEILEEGMRGTYIGPVVASVLLNRPALTVAIPVIDNNGETLGVLAGQADLDQIESVMQDRTGLGDTRVAYMIDPEGRVLASAMDLSDGGVGVTGPGLSGGLLNPLGAFSSEGIDALLATRTRQNGRYLNYLEEPVLGEYRWLQGLELGMVIEAPSSELFQITLAAVGVNVVLVVISVGFAVAGSFFIARGISRPLAEVAEVATVVAGGDLTRAIPVARMDEVGQMALAFNGMTERLRDMVGSLEDRVARRTADLERRSSQLQTASRVARLAASIREIDELLKVAAAQIGEQFGFYHVGIYLHDDAGRALVLRAASHGSALMERGFRLELGASSGRVMGPGLGIIADVARTGRSSIVQDVRQDVRYLAVPELPDTRSEMSLPLRVRDEVIGVLDVQSVEIGAFSESGDTTYLQTLADQLALAIENARLFSEAQQRLREIGRLVQVQRHEGWQEMLAEREISSYTYDGIEVRGGESARIAADIVLSVKDASEVEADSLGTVRVKLGRDRQVASPDVELASAIVSEAALALERARLFGGTQRALLEADTLYRCGRAIVEAANVDEVLSALTGYVAAPGIDTMVLLLVRPGRAGNQAGIEVTSVWHAPARGKGSPLRGGEHWGLSDLPVLALHGTSQGIPGLADSLVIDDVATSSMLDAESREMLLHTVGFRSVLVLPLRSGPDLVGWLLMGTTGTPYTFSTQEVRLYQGLADQVAPVVRSFELLALATRRAERERAIAAIGENVRRFTDVETILQTSVRELGRTLRASEGVIRLHPGAAPPVSRGEHSDHDTGNGGEPSAPSPDVAVEEPNV